MAEVWHDVCMKFLDWMMIGWWLDVIRPNQMTFRVTKAKWSQQKGGTFQGNSRGFTQVF